MHYERNDVDFFSGGFPCKGRQGRKYFLHMKRLPPSVLIFLEMRLNKSLKLTHSKEPFTKNIKNITIYPASHHVTSKRKLKKATETIIEELKERTGYFRSENKLIEAQRIEERTNYDLEMMQELGYCNGIENYSRHLSGRSAGEPASTLIDYFPDDLLVFIDESHVSIPQIRAMYKGDRSRKTTLVQYGFRLPSALDNRPLTFDEFTSKIPQTVYVSATPADYELKLAGSWVVEQIVRPTGLVDPEIEVRSAENQVDDLYKEILKRQKQNERVLITTLTKRMAEDLTDYYSDLGIRVRYLHSEIKTLERMEIIRDLRMNVFDVLIGINLLREGLDIPEVSLVAILDADKEGFLRSERSLVQTFGRAARNINGSVIMYAEHVTNSMRQAINESGRRQKIQIAHNRKHNIKPTSIQKAISESFEFMHDFKEIAESSISELVDEYQSLENIEDIIKALEKEMIEAANDLEF